MTVLSHLTLRSTDRSSGVQVDQETTVGRRPAWRWKQCGIKAEDKMLWVGVKRYLVVLVLGLGGPFTNQVTFPAEGQNWKVIRKHWACVPCCNQELQPRLENWGNSQSYKKQAMDDSKGSQHRLPDGMLMVAATLHRLGPRLASSSASTS